MATPVPNEEEEEELFEFNAPSFYDLDDPEFEQQYINNKDGYFGEEIRLPEQKKSTHYLSSTENSVHRRESLENQIQCELEEKLKSLSVSQLKKTHAESPKWHQKPKPPQPVKLSSTSRELLQIEQELQEIQQQKKKNQQFHEKAKLRKSICVHQGTSYSVSSTAQLTLPVTPQFQTEKRPRRHCDHQNHNTIIDNILNAELEVVKEGFVKPEDLMSREYDNTLTQPQKPFHPTEPHSPFLITSERAKERIEPHQEPPTVAKKIKYQPTRTIPKTPELLTRTRANIMNQNRKPIISTMDKISEEDERELNNKFHARPINKKIFQASTTTDQVTRSHKRPPIQPKSPNFATARRAQQRQQQQEQQHPENTSLFVFKASVSNANNNSNALNRRKKKTASKKKKDACSSLTEVLPLHLRSQNRHEMYKKKFEEKIKMEEALAKERRNFKAQPIPVYENRRKRQGNSSYRGGSVTEVKPFRMAGDQMHELAQMKLDLLKQEKEARLKRNATVKATPMPMSTTERKFFLNKCEIPLTECNSPVLQSSIQAQRRKQFDYEDSKRREMIDLQQKELEKEKLAIEERELAALKKKLAFKAAPVPAHIYHQNRSEDDRFY